MSLCRFPKAEVFETHVSEDLAVNHCWDVSSDVYFVGFFFCLCLLEKNQIHMWTLRASLSMKK